MGSSALNFPVLTPGKTCRLCLTPTRPHSAPKTNFSRDSPQGWSCLGARARPAPPSAARPPPRAETRRGKRAAASPGRHFGFCNWAEARDSLLSAAARRGRLGRRRRGARAQDADYAGQRRDAFPPPGQPEPQRWSRVGARRGTSVSDAGGARGAATAGARRRGPGRPHVRAAGAAAARAARGGVWGKRPPAAGTAEVRGRSPESGGEVGGGWGRARGATGTPRPGLSTCQQGVARARSAAACGGAG